MDWSGFKEVLSLYEADNQEDLNGQSFSDHYGTLYIDWNKKEIHQVQADYYFDGFYVPTLYFLLSNKEVVDNFLFNLNNPNNSKEIDCYCQEEGEDFDFKLYFNADTSNYNIIEVIKNYRKIGKDSSKLNEYGLSANINFERIKDKEIMFVKFPLNNNGWKTIKYDYNFENGVELTKKILNIK